MSKKYQSGGKKMLEIGETEHKKKIFNCKVISKQQSNMSS
jgi:hypothetical protein